MKLMISTSSMIPIYEQIMDGIKKMIASGELSDQDALPSVRILANELKISALTVKKAYDRLEEEGLTRTIHGKGTFVTHANPALIAEQRRREMEEEMGKLVTRAKQYGLEKEELFQILDLMWETEFVNG